MAALRLLLDESVLVEYVGERQPYGACWSMISALQMVGYAELWAMPDAYRRMFLALREEVPEEEARRALRGTLDYVNVCPVTQEDVLAALAGAGDYDESLAVVCARKVKVDYAVTRSPVRLDASSLSTAGAKAFSPEGLFGCLERERGLSFSLVDF